MSYYAVLDNTEESGGDVASAAGWMEFAAWVDDLEADAPELRHLRTWGWSQELEPLMVDLNIALKEGGDDPDAIEVASGLLSMLEKRGDAETIIITDGAGVADDEKTA